MWCSSKFRYRTLHSTFKNKTVLVLQISEEVDFTYDDNSPKTGKHTVWRDATIEDLTEIVNYAPRGS